MKKAKLKPLRILLKISLLFGLSYSLYTKAEAKEDSNLQHLSNGKGLTLHERMSKIETENKEHKAEIYLLKTKLDDGVNSISKLEAESMKRKTENAVLKTRIDEVTKENQQLIKRVARLEAKASNNCSTTEDDDCILDRGKRPARLLPLQLFYNMKNHSEDQNAASRFVGPATNCSELGMLGYTLNGYYLVKSNDPSNRDKIVIVYCKFRQSKELTIKQVLQTVIGNVEVKTKSIYFYAKLTDNIGAGWIPFKRRDVNVGDAMGEWAFTAPVAGIYHFVFYGTVINPGSDFLVSFVYRDVKGPQIMYQDTRINCTNCSFSFVNMATTYHLKAGDQIQLYKPLGTGTLAGDWNTYSSRQSLLFGWLVEEDLSLY